MHKFLEFVLVLLPLLGCLRTGNQAFGQFDAVQDVFLGEALTVGESALTICLSALAFFVQTFAFNLELLFVLEGERRVQSRSRRILNGGRQHDVGLFAGGLLVRLCRVFFAQLTSGIHRLLGDRSLNVLRFFEKVDAATSSKHSGTVSEVHIQLDGVEFVKLLCQRMGLGLLAFRLGLLIF